MDAMALGTSARQPAPGDARTPVHPAWWVAATAFVALIGAAGFRAAPGVLLVPLEEEFGWSRGVLSRACWPSWGSSTSSARSHPGGSPTHGADGLTATACGTMRSTVRRP